MTRIEQKAVDKELDKYPPLNDAQQAQRDKFIREAHERWPNLSKLVQWKGHSDYGLGCRGCWLEINGPAVECGVAAFHEECFNAVVALE